MTAIILIGFMGAGKTTIGEHLAAKSGLSLIDLDAQIVAKIKMPIQQYFDNYGEAAFREQETAVLAETIATGGIIATGGGIVVKEMNRALLKEQPQVVYLRADFDTLYNRIKQDPINVRPLATDKTAEEVRAVFAPRVPWYEEAAAVIVDTDQKSPAVIAEEILERLENA